MSLFWFGKKDARNNHDFDEKDRELSIELRRQKAQIAQQKAQLDLELMRLRNEKEKAELTYQIEEAKASLEELFESPEEDSTSSASRPEDAMMMMLLSKLMSPAAGITPISPPAPPTPQAPAGDSISDDDLITMWESVPAHYRKIAKKLSDAQLGAYIRTQLPRIDEDSLRRAIIVVRGR